MAISSVRRPRLALLLLALGIASFGATPAFALSHYFTMGSTLYHSVDGAAPTSVTISNGSANLTVPSLAFDPDGNLWGFSNLASARGFYQIDPGTGAATLQFNPAGSNLEINTFDFRETAGGGVELLAFVNVFPAGANDYFQRFNLAGGSLGTFDTLDTNTGFIASGYVSTSDGIFAVNGVDYDLRSFDPDTSVPGGNLIGDLGITWSQGAGALSGGELYFGYRPGAHNPGTGGQDHLFQGLRFGRVDLTTGAFTQDFSFTEAQTPFGPAMGYAVLVPEPGTILLLMTGLAGLAARRRRG